MRNAEFSTLRKNPGWPLYSEAVRRMLTAKKQISPQVLMCQASQ
jgi:hypothetical protein